MGRLRIINDYLKMNDADLIAKASNINSGMAAHSNYFPDAAADLVVLTAALSNFDTAVVAADTRDKIKIAVKNNLKADLKTVLRKLSSIVTHSAPQDDKSVWLASGFTISGDSNSAFTIDTPQNFTVEVGKVPGQITMRCDRLIGAKYIFLFAPPATAADTWQLAFNKKNECTISGLTLLQQYSFRIVGVGSKGQFEFSEIIVKTVV